MEVLSMLRARFRPVLTGVVTAWLFCSAVTCPASAGDVPPRQVAEPQAKAAFILNVARYVTWPRTLSGGETFTIGILGKQAGSVSVEDLKSRTVQGKRVVVRVSQDIDDLRECRIVFIDTSERRHLSKALHALRGEPVLTMSDSDGFSRLVGGMLCLQVVNGRITMSINLTNARAAGLDISSQLLKLAAEVF